MKGLVFATAFLAFLLTCQGGAAKTLEEVLKEKGVITEADYKEVTAARPVTYQAGKGFTFTSPDGKFQLSLGGGNSITSTWTGTTSTARPGR